VADDEPAPAPDTPASSKVELGRADLGPMVQALGDQLHEDRERRRAREGRRGHSYEPGAYQLAATIRQIGPDAADPLRLPRWLVETLSELPHGLGKCHGIGRSREEAVRSYQKAFSRMLIDGRVMGRADAAKAGQTADVHIVPVVIGPDGRVLT
jgi:hypothetical protein